MLAKIHHHHHHPPCTMSVELVGLQGQLDSPSLSFAKWYSFCSVSSPQCSMSSAHSLCGINRLFFPSITPKITALCFLSSPILAKFANRLIFRLIAFCMMISFLS